MLDWPWRKFDRFYDAFMRRSLIETLERRKEAMIAALWSNSGFEGQEGADARKGAIEELEEHYDQAVEKLMGGGMEEEVEDIDEDNPFFAQGKKGLEKILAPREDEGTVRSVLRDEGQYDHLEIDQ